MKARNFTAWALLVTAGCAFESSGKNEVGLGGTATTDPDPATETDGDTSTTSTSMADTVGGAGASSTSGASTTSGAGTGGSPCGNGIVDPGEECDDGNTDDLDGCSSQCTVPTCDDGLHDGDETDVDCGGSCGECSLCAGCLDETDCGGDMRCDESGRCVTHYEMAVDWVVNCPSQAQGVTLQLPGGTYRATAIESAGTLWLPPHEPPSTGYFYEAKCDGVNFEQLHTPEGVRYIDVPTAFAAMVSQTETFSFVGGAFTCWLTDGGCDDNDGGIAFSLEYVCE